MAKSSIDSDIDNDDLNQKPKTAGKKANMDITIQSAITHTWAQ